MRFREGGRLDTSGVSDRRGMGGGRGIAVGGGGLGLVGVIIVVILQLLGGGGGGGGRRQRVRRTGRARQRASRPTTPSSTSGARTSATRTTPRSARSSPRSTRSRTTGARQLGGALHEDRHRVLPRVGADQLRRGIQRLRALLLPGRQAGLHRPQLLRPAARPSSAREGGAFVDAYVLAHEYGHHVQDILGTNQQVTPGETGATSGSVRLELQADCYAGTWANHATTVPDASGQPLITEITQDDVNRALDAASPDRRRLHPAEPRQRPGRPELVHPRLVGAAAEVVQHGLPER